MLQDESGIAPDLIAARGYRTVTRKADLMALGFARWQCRVPALLVPVYNPYGELVLYQARPDAPRIKDGQVIKYETPHGASMALDVPPSAVNRQALRDPHGPLWITEGAKKGDALVTHGACALALLGVWNWRGTNDAGGKTVLADFEAIALQDRQVYIVFDSDVMTKPAVHQALARFKGFLESRHARVALIYLPPGPGGQKQGVDDYLVAGHGLVELLALASPTLRALPRDEAPPTLPYQATPQGLVWRKPTLAGPVTVPLSNFTATITADIVEDDGAETRRLFELETRHAGQVAQFRVRAGHFDGMNWVAEHLGATAVIFPGMLQKDHTRAAIKLLSSDVQARYLYAHLGWRQFGDTWGYLHAGGAIGAQGVLAGVEVQPGEALAHYQLPVPPTGEALQSAIRASLQFLEVAPETVTLPLYSALWRAPLGRTEMSLHVAGPTGAGKTELAALIQQHFGAAMHAKALPASWSSTGNALESVAFQAKDAVLVIDDFCPTGSQADIQRAHKEGDRVLRAQGNRSGRQRLRPDGTLRPAKAPRGLLLSTGEDIPRGHSLRARLLIVEVPAHTLQDHQVPLTACQHEAAEGLYAQAMAGYVQWLAQHYDTIQRALQPALIALRAQAPQGLHPRTPEIMAQCGLGLQHFLAYAADAGALTVAQCQTLWQRAWSTLATVAEAQHEHQRSEAPERRFLALLSAALTAGHAHVVDAQTLGQPRQPHAWGWTAQARGTGPYAQETWQPHGDCVGWVSAEGRLYLNPDAAFRVVQAFAASQQAPLPLTQRTLWKRLAEQGLLAVEPSQAQHTVRREIGPDKKRQRVIEILSAFYAPEISPNSPDDDKSQQTDDIPRTLVDCFPCWYAIQTVPEISPASSGTCPQSSPPGEAALRAGVAERTDEGPEALRTDSGTDSGTDFSLRISPQTSSQPLEKTATDNSGLLGLISEPSQVLRLPAVCPSASPPRPGGPLTPSGTCLWCGAAWRDEASALCASCRSLPTGASVPLTVGQQVRLAYEGKVLLPGVFVITHLESTTHETRVTVRARDSGQTGRYPSTCCVPVPPRDGPPPTRALA